MRNVTDMFLRLEEHAEILGELFAGGEFGAQRAFFDFQPFLADHFAGIRNGLVKGNRGKGLRGIVMRRGAASILA